MKVKTIIGLPITNRYIRKYCEAPYYPVKLIPGDSPPIKCGKSFYYETNGGKEIYHPSAYAKKGWSNMRYCPSTICIEVGEDWDILKAFPKIKNSVDYLCFMLHETGYYVTCVPSTTMYNIYSHNDEDHFYLDLPLSKFRIVAKRIIKLISFS